MCVFFSLEILIDSNPIDYFLFSLYFQDSRSQLSTNNNTSNVQLRESVSTLVPDESVQRTPSITGSIQLDSASSLQRLSKPEAFGSVGNLAAIDSDDDDDDIDRTFEKAKSVSFSQHITQQIRFSTRETIIEFKKSCFFVQRYSCK